MREITGQELSFVSGGNARDTTTGSFNEPFVMTEKPLDPMHGFGFWGTGITRLVRYLIQLY